MNPRTRYPAIHTLIINHFGEPEETPEHNALQALFVEEDFRRRFVLHVLGGRERVFVAAIRDKNSASPGWQKKISEHRESVRELEPQAAWDRAYRHEQGIGCLRRGKPDVGS